MSNFISNAQPVYQNLNSQKSKFKPQKQQPEQQLSSQEKNNSKQNSNLISNRTYLKSNNISRINFNNMKKSTNTSDSHQDSQQSLKIIDEQIQKTLLSYREMNQNENIQTNNLQESQQFILSSKKELNSCDIDSLIQIIDTCSKQYSEYIQQQEQKIQQLQNQNLQLKELNQQQQFQIDQLQQQQQQTNDNQNIESLLQVIQKMNKENEELKEENSLLKLENQKAIQIVSKYKQNDIIKKINNKMEIVNKQDQYKQHKSYDKTTHRAMKQINTNEKMKQQKLQKQFSTNQLKQ